MDKMGPLCLLFLALPAVAWGERCEVSHISVHCESRCAGVNASSFSSSNPPTHLLLAPADTVEMLQLEETDRAGDAPAAGDSEGARLAGSLQPDGLPVPAADRDGSLCDLSLCV